jgi:hypothetical protein
MIEHFVFTERRIFNSLPEKLQILFTKRSFQISMFAFFGIANGVGENSLYNAFLSIIGTSLIMLLALLLARKMFAGNQASLVNYLPRGKALVVIGVLLFGVYAVHLFESRPEAFPGLTGHGMIWLAYFTFGYLLYRSQKIELPLEENKLSVLSKIDGKWVYFTGIFLLGAIIAVLLLKSLQPILVMILWGVGIPFGLLMFAKAVKQLSTKKGVFSTNIPRK